MVKNIHEVYVTGSLKGVPKEPTVDYKVTQYYYIKIREGGKIFYYGKEGALVDESSAVVFEKEEEAFKIREALSEKYLEVRVFSTTKKLY